MVLNHCYKGVDVRKRGRGGCKAEGKGVLNHCYKGVNSQHICLYFCSVVYAEKKKLI